MSWRGALHSWGLVAAYALAVVLTLIAPHCARAEFGPYDADVVRVVDGDTVDVTVHVWPGQTIAARVRLLGVDTPELRGGCEAEKVAARAARDWLTATLTGRRVRVTVTAPDAFGRPLGRLTVDGADVSRALIERGLGVAYGETGRWCDE